MSEEEKSKLDYLGKQYRRLLINLKNNERIIQIKEKCVIIFFISFIFTFSAIAIVTQYINNIIFYLLGVIFEYLNVYVYITFCNSYIEDSKKESDRLIQDIDNISNKINNILQKNNLNDEDFYKELEIDIIN